jgi:uncharacterized protein with von Willebrand factor type A (vWA) domain
MPEAGAAAGDAAPGLWVQCVALARLLREAGVPVGTSRVASAVDALSRVGLERREDVYWALGATLLSRRDQLEVFDQAFRLTWEAVARAQGPAPLGMPATAEAAGRVAEAHARLGGGDEAEALPLVRTAGERRFHASVMERLGSRDFAAMSLDELAQVRAALAGFELVLPEVPVRRTAPAARGRRPDLRGTLRAAARSGGEVVRWVKRAPRRRRPPLVLLCDISGSMSRYTRVLLQFAHALVNDHGRVHAFVFGTRLTDISRDLRRRDADTALERVGRSAPDWSGGTRIAAALGAFNRLWSRRVLGSGAVVLLITDGLERDSGADLAAQVERLQRSCRRLVWLNPLLRFEGFEPRAAGVRAILPHVDEFLPVHNLHSLGALARAFASHGFQNTRSPRSKTPWT